MTKKYTEPVKIAFIARAGAKLRIPRKPMAKPIKISWLSHKRPSKRKEIED